MPWLQWLAIEYEFCFFPGISTGTNTVYNPETKRFVVEKNNWYEGFSSTHFPQVIRLVEEEVEGYLKGEAL